MRIDFDKMQGAGNDFILIDNRENIVAKADRPRLATTWCRRCFGIGADGVIFIENDAELDFAWDFYNADGSIAEMCGNGARCAARYANRIGMVGETMIFRTIAGPIKARLTDMGAKVQLTDVPLPAGSETVEVDGQKFDLWFLNSGVPHAVVRVDDLEAVDVRGLGRALRNHARFAPSGTNVNFFCPGTGDSLAIRTYERGVEDETLACGTGSVATSIVAGVFLGLSSPILAHTRGGGDLVIHYKRVGDVAQEVFLEGGAETVFKGSFEF